MGWSYLRTIAAGVGVLGVGAVGSFVLFPEGEGRLDPRLSALPIIAALSQGPLEEHGSDPVLSPAEVVALRFPDIWDEAPIATPQNASMRDAGEAVPSGEPVRRIDPLDGALFSPFPSLAPKPLNQPTIVASVDPVPPKVAVATKTVVPAAPRPTGRPGAVFNDAQIATIKQRLRLTPDQQHMWPAVEAALRNLSYPKGHKPGVDVSRVAAIDPHSSDVQNLSSAAVPLVMSFSDDQRRELRLLAHVAGLEDLVPKF